MEAAVGRNHFASLRFRSRRMHLAAFAAVLVHLPCWSQDTAFLGLDVAPSTADQVQALQSQASPVMPRVSLTLGTPIVAPGGLASAAGAAGGQALDLGVQWRQPVLTGRHVDITAWRRMTPEGDALTMIQQRDPVYGARVEINLQGRKRGLVADRRFIGLQLDSGARITLRRKDGNPVLYYRSQF
jgi:hypothetical protein